MILHIRMPQRGAIGELVNFEYITVKWVLICKIQFAFIEWRKFVFSWTTASTFIHSKRDYFFWTGNIIFFFPIPVRGNHNHPSAAPKWAQTFLLWTATQNRCKTISVYSKGRKQQPFIFPNPPICTVVPSKVVIIEPGPDGSATSGPFLSGN